MSLAVQEASNAAAMIGAAVIARVPWLLPTDRFKPTPLVTSIAVRGEDAHASPPLHLQRSSIRRAIPTRCWVLHA